MIKLGGREILRGPGCAAIEGNIASAIVAVDHALIVIGIDPKIVIVAMRRPDGLKFLTRVGRFQKRYVHDVDGVFLFRVGIDSREIERALQGAPVLAHERPGRARIVGSEDAAVVRFHHGVNAIGIGAGDGHADLADDALRQAGVARNLRPGVAAIR